MTPCSGTRCGYTTHEEAAHNKHDDHEICIIINPALSRNKAERSRTTGKEQKPGRKNNRKLSSEPKISIVNIISSKHRK
jgi:hypothetical protein